MSHKRGEQETRPTDRRGPAVAESKHADDDIGYIVRKLRKLLRSESKDQSVQSIFRKLDRNGDQRVTALEFRRGLKELGLPLDDREIREVIRHCDLDGDGEISYLEFEQFIEANEAKDSSVQDILDRLRSIIDREARYSYNGVQVVFEAFDEDFSGDIDTDELHQGLREFGITLTSAEADGIMLRFPGRDTRRTSRDDRKLRYRDFVAAMSGRAPQSHEHKDAHGDRTSSRAVRRLAEEVERCARTRDGALDIRSVFREMDADGSGALNRHEIKDALERLGVTLSRSELLDVMDFFGEGANGEIHYEKFVQFALKEDPATKRIAQRVRDEIERIAQRSRAPPDYRAAFREIDKDGSGYLDSTEFRSAMKNLGLRLSSSECTQLMNMFDENGDDRVSLTEFLEFVDAAPTKPESKNHR